MAVARREVKIGSAGVGYSPFLQPAVWLADHISQLPDKPMIWLDYHVTARGFRNGFLELQQGLSDLCLANTRGICSLAMRGNGLFDKPFPNLRALASFPHHDWSTFAVDASLGIRTFADLNHAKEPIRLVTGYLDGDNVVGWLTMEILRRHGVDPQTLLDRGGEFISVGVFNSCGEVVSGNANAISEEGAFSGHFREMFRKRRLTCLSMDPEVAHGLDKDFGWKSMVVPANYYEDQTEPFLAPDYSTWVLCCREDLDDDIAYQVARSAVEHGAELSVGHFHLAPHLAWPFHLPPLIAGEAVDTSPVPLHRGSARLYRERGLI